MPGAWAHSHYWSGAGVPDDPPVDQPSGSGRRGYIGWQAAVIAISVLLAVLTPGG